MDTKSNIPAVKKVVSVAFPNLKEKGFGWDGSFTREAWRKACLDNFLAGKEQFEQWQASWKDSISTNLPRVSLSAILTYEDGTTETTLNTFYQKVSPATLDFVALTYENDVIASYYVFNGDAEFSRAVFTGDAEFGNANFSGTTNFQSASFSGIANFSNAAFSKSANFSDATFKGLTGFSNTTFSKSADFSDASFGWLVFFRNATFSGEADYSRTTFSGDADFHSAIFRGYATYSSATFSGDANYSSTLFSGRADYGGTSFEKDVAFFKAVFKNQSNFKNSTFRRIVNFENAEIQNVGHFENAKFTGELPNFLGVDNAKTLLVFSGDEYFSKIDTQGNAPDRIAQLKRLAEEQGQTDQMLMFNAFELNAKAKQPNAGWGLKVVTWLYDNTADFGRSFTRPLVIYTAILFLTFLIALEHSAHNAPRNYTQSGCEKYVWWVERVTWVGDKNCLGGEKVHKLTGIRAAGEYTLYRAVGALDFADSDKQTIEVANRVFGQDYEPWWMRIWGIFKAIASTALLFLAALGLRNKYRIK